jgi:hypothetical protein
MILSERFVDLVHNSTAAIWASNCDSQQVPELARLQGVQVEADKEHITFYVSLKFGEHLINNFAITDKLTFLMAIILTNESYQIKGNYIWHRPCSSAEIKYQEVYYQGFCDTLERQGLSKEKAYKAYYHQPSMVVYMHIKEVYEQTPKVGTGEKLHAT